MIASETLKAKRILSQTDLHGHHTFIDCDRKELHHWARQLQLPIFVTADGWQCTYSEVYLGKQITITLKAN